jgi:hypothetical protein
MYFTVPVTDNRNRAGLEPGPLTVTSKPARAHGLSEGPCAPRFSERTPLVHNSLYITSRSLDCDWAETGDCCISPRNLHVNNPHMKFLHAKLHQKVHFTL